MGLTQLDPAGLSCSPWPGGHWVGWGWPSWVLPCWGCIQASERLLSPVPCSHPLWCPTPSSSGTQAQGSALSDVPHSCREGLGHISSAHAAAPQAQ